MTLEQEITKLTQKWYKYVNLDHHKDRDCHWTIEKIFSYGDEPYYIVSHHGYILESWASPKCGTMELAETILRDKLKNEIASAIIHLKEVSETPDAMEWFGSSKEDINKLIKELSK